MFQLLREAALRGKAKSWAELGLNRKERLDITTGGGFCGKACALRVRSAGCAAA